MGLDVNGTRFMLYAKSLGVDFTKTAMIGRQCLNLGPADLKRSLTLFDSDFEAQKIQQLFADGKAYAEPFFEHLGASEIHSFDCSDYEDATHIHDMNDSIADQHKRQYSVVFDGGSLEHVFNFPTAIKNCMEMVRVGGHFLAISPANNFMGHGFYQFSPELFFNVFGESNGYQPVSVIAVEDAPLAKWYLVDDPAAVRSRVSLLNSKPVYLLAIAKRVADIEPFQAPPQQSDYVQAWKQEQHGNGVGSKFMRSAHRYAPYAVKRFASRVLRRWHAGFDRRYFHPFAPQVKVEHSSTGR